MKNYLSTVFFTVFIVTIISIGSFSALAQDEENTAIGNPIKTAQFEDILTRITQVLLISAIPVFVVILAFAAYYLVVSQGDAQKRKTAANLLKYGFIGFIIIVFARAIVAVMFSFFD
ncbi:MAG: hypothetical protein WDZ39_00180 [Candidatus Spechtbacterales bacterium]